MSKSVAISIIDLLESKVGVCSKSHWNFVDENKHIEDFVTSFNNNHRLETFQCMPSTIPEGLLSKDSMMLPNQKENSSAQYLNIQKFKKTKISFLKKFDNTWSKFQGFVNQIQLITFIQPQHYSIFKLLVGINRTLLVWQSSILVFSSIWKKIIDFE